MQRTGSNGLRFGLGRVFGAGKGENLGLRWVIRNNDVESWEGAVGGGYREGV